MLVSRQREKRLQLTKKKKVRLNNMVGNWLNNCSQSSIDQFPGQSGEKTEQTFSQNIALNKVTKKDIKTDKINDGDNTFESNKNSNLSENGETKACTDRNNGLKNCNRISTISVRKIEDLCKTPMKNDALINLDNIKVKSVHSLEDLSCSNVNTNSVEWHSRTNNDSQSFASYKRDVHHLDTNDISKKLKKRKLSLDIDDCDQFLDTQSSLCSNDVNDMEPIAMLHDLNSVMEFEESKVSIDFLHSTANGILENEQGMEVPKNSKLDPPTSDDNKANIKLKNTEDKEQSTKKNSKANLERRSKSYKCREKATNNSKSREKTKESDTNTNNNSNVLNDVLGELDIEFKSEDTNEQEDTKKQENIKKQDIIPADKMKALYNLQVKIKHEVPPQHKVEHTAGSKTLTKEERNRFLKHGPIKNGVFTPTEDKIITNNWIAFCKEHDWNPKHVKPFLNMVNENKFHIRSLKERQKFGQFLANGLPWRTLYSVYHRFKHLYGNHERNFKRYTASEDAKILSYLKDKQNKEKTHKKFIELGKMLHRTKHSVWLRYQLLQKMQNQECQKLLSEVTWTLPLIAKFLQTLMNLTLCEDVQELKDAIIPKVVWEKLEEKLNIQHIVLKTFWIHQLHMQLFCPEPIYLNDIKVKLIEYIYGKGIASTREIVWSNLVNYFDGVTSIFLCKVFLYLVQEAAAKMHTNDFPVIVEYLYHEKIRKIRNESTDKFLPRLSYDNGEVKIIDEDMNENIEI